MADPASQPGLYALTLGGVPFFTSECPDNLKIGLAVHYHTTDLIGGGRVVQTFGTHPKAISWTGRIWGPNVEARKKALRQLLVAQSEIIVSHKTERYYCVVIDLDVDLLAIDANYSITIEVTRDANGSQSSATPISVDTQVSVLATQAAEQASSVALIDAAGAVPLTQAVTNVQGALTTAGPISQLTGSTLTTTLNTVNASVATASSYASSVGPGAAQFLPAQQLVTSLSLIAKNVQQGQSANTIQAFGESLAHISATHYGTPDYAPQLAAANGIFGLRTPPGVPTTIVLPPFPVAA